MKSNQAQKNIKGYVSIDNYGSETPAPALSDDRSSYSQINKEPDNSSNIQSRAIEITENLLNSIKSPESSPKGVSLDTVNIQHFKNDIQSTLFGVKPTNAEILHKNYPNILFFDSAWKLLNPSKWYVRLLVDCLGIAKNECEGYFTG
ncbi:unnamed protein product, partial [marine sediment metagenome]